MEGHHPPEFEDKEATKAPKKCRHADSKHYSQGVVGLCFCRRGTKPTKILSYLSDPDQDNTYWNDP